MSSLSAEPCEGASFVCSVFEVDGDGFVDSEGRICEAFREREEEFDIVKGVAYRHLSDGGGDEGDDAPSPAGPGVLCCRSTDDAYIAQWGMERFRRKYQSRGVDTIWGYGRDSGLKPCATYLRHCLLAAENMGDECHRSFLDETFLVDRVTTIREYLNGDGRRERIMNSLPPPQLAERYSG